MSEKKTELIVPGKPGESVPRHSFKRRFSGIRRVHVIVAVSVLAVLVAGGATWAALGGGPDGGGSEVVDDAASNPQTATPSATAPATNSSGSGYPVPTWSSSRGNKTPKGMPSGLSAKRDGNNVVLKWKDNTNNEDGFTVFVTQGRTSFQINVPAGTTQYKVAAANSTSTCFAVVPFSWEDRVVSSSAEARECTDRRHS